jgi:NAD-dependent dihydropyrimidine dehydrogenase PreA subunit
MFYIDDNKCTGCGACVDVCPQGAISLQNDVAVINQALCSKCGNCAEVCPTGAIRAKAPVYAELGKGGERMPFGDRTGPRGMGPMTGRGAGYCAGFGWPSFANPIPGRRWFGFGWRGWGRGRGRGFGWRRYTPYWYPRW